MQVYNREEAIGQLSNDDNNCSTSKDQIFYVWEDATNKNHTLT